LDYRIEDYFDHDGMHPWGLIALEQRLTKNFINREVEIPEIKIIEDSKFDVGYSTFLMWENIILKRFNIPAVKWAAYLPDPPIMVFNN